MFRWCSVFFKVEMFCVAEPSSTAGDQAFEKILNLQRQLYSDLELHFR